jgi:hypothetical protein
VRHASSASALGIGTGRLGGSGVHSRAGGAPGNLRGGALHRITVLHMPGCNGGRAALDVAALIAEHRLDVSVQEVIIRDEWMARAVGFRGSPTVFVDGHEVEPDARIPIASLG